MVLEGKNYLTAPIEWARGEDPEYPYEAEHEGHKLLVRLNDFPEAALYALIADGEEITNFDDWPDSWTRPTVSETNLNSHVSQYLQLNRILIVDDHQLLRLGLKSLLRGRFFIVGEAGTAAEAIELMTKHQWDVAIIDFSLPDMSALDLIAEMQRFDPEILVVILSLHLNKRLAQEAFKAGAAACVDKFFVAEEIGAALEKIRRGERYCSKHVVDVTDDDSKMLSLTPSEREVLRLIAQGHSNKQIAVALNIGVRSVEAHRAHVLNILDRLRNLGRISLIPLEEQQRR